MEGAAGAGHGVSLSQLPSRKEWRVVSEHSVRTSGNEDLERSKLGHSDERTIYEGQEALDAVDFCSIQIEGIMGVDDGILQQRIHCMARQREQLQQMEIEIRAQMIAKSEILEMQNTFRAQLKEQGNVAARLQEQLCERDQTKHELERKMEEKERELHAVRLDNEAAWAKEDLLREQNKELANFRRERDNIDAERAHHIKQMHDLQEHINDKERQLLELQEQHRVAKETILYKDEQIREAQAWMARVQEIEVLQSSTLQAELRERTEQYNHLWLGCQRQFAEMERVHIQAIQQLQFELARARGRTETYKIESNTSQDASICGSQVVPSSGSHVEANGGNPADVGSGDLPNGNLENSQTFISFGTTNTQSHAPSLPFTPPSILGMPSYLPAGQITALLPYVMPHQGANQSVPSHVPQSHVGHVPATVSFQQWQNQQAVSESAPVFSQNEFSLSQCEENPSRTESGHSYEFSINGPGLHSGYLSVHTSPKLDPIPQESSAEEAQTLESVEKTYHVTPEVQHSLQQISSQLDDALCLEPLNQASENKAEESDDINTADNGLECRDVMAEQKNSVASPPSKASIHLVHFAEATLNNTAEASSCETFVSTGQKNTLLTGKVPETALLDERALLACIARTIPPGGKIRISSTLPNRLGKMLAPLHWHDYRKKYGKLDDFVASHSELFVIEGDYIQLREGALGIIAATAAVAKVAAAAVASPCSSFFPSVTVTPMAHASRVKKLPSMESKPMRSSVDCTHSPANQSQHSNGFGFVNVSGGLSNMRTLGKSEDTSKLDDSEIRPGQPIMVSAQNGVHSDRFGVGNLQIKGPVHARAGASFIGKQPGRTNSVHLASRR